MSELAERFDTRDPGAKQVAGKIRCLQAGELVSGVVDRLRGY